MSLTTQEADSVVAEVVDIFEDYLPDDVELRDSHQVVLDDLWSALVDGEPVSFERVAVELLRTMRGTTLRRRKTLRYVMNELEHM